MIIVDKKVDGKITPAEIIAEDRLDIYIGNIDKQ